MDSIRQTTTKNQPLDHSISKLQSNHTTVWGLPENPTGAKQEQVLVWYQQTNDTWYQPFTEPAFDRSTQTK
jgi:hypothetical protein